MHAADHDDMKAMLSGEAMSAGELTGCPRGRPLDSTALAQWSLTRPALRLFPDDMRWGDGLVLLKTGQ